MNFFDRTFFCTTTTQPHTRLTHTQLTHAHAHLIHTTHTRTQTRTHLTHTHENDQDKFETFDGTIRNKKIALLNWLLKLNKLLTFKQSSSTSVINIFELKIEDFL